MDFYAGERQNPPAARRVVEAIRDTCRRAGEDPQLGRNRPELGAGVRSKVVIGYRCMIYVRIAPPTVQARVLRRPDPRLQLLEQLRESFPLQWALGRAAPHG